MKHADYFKGVTGKATIDDIMLGTGKSVKERGQRVYIRASLLWQCRRKETSKIKTVSEGFAMRYEQVVYVYTRRKAKVWTLYQS